MLHKRVLGIITSICLLFPLATDGSVVSAAEKLNPITERNIEVENREGKEFSKQNRKLELDTVSEVIGAELANERNHIERQYDKEESLYNIVFENTDGTETLYMFDYPVKYVSETGEIKDIKLDVKEDEKKPGAYKSAEHGIETSFSKRLSEGINLKDDDVSITLQPAEKLYSVTSTGIPTANLIDGK